MQELEKMINVYHIGFIVCVVLACVFFAISVLLFFKFDIRKIIDIRTGRGAKKTIQKMEEINARTGKLRQDMVSHTPSMLRPEDRIAYPATEPNLDLRTEETAMLSQNMQPQTQPSKIKLPGNFKIEKEIMWTHTEEML